MVVAGSPDQLEILLTLANSRHAGSVECGVTFDGGAVHDHLRDPADACRFLEANHIVMPGSFLRRHDLRDLRQLRRAVMSVVAHDTMAPAASLMRRARYRVDEEGRYEPVAPEWRGFISRLLP